MHSTPAMANKGFFGSFLDNLKQEYDKDKEMKENLKRFRAKAKELEESDALRKAREKFVSDAHARPSERRSGSGRSI